MRALIFDKEPEIHEVPMPRRERGEALIRVLTAGICNTDLEIFRGYMKFTGIPGHEFVGMVEEADNPYWTGKRVVGEINCACHRCHYCQLEMPRHCLNRSVLGIHGRNGCFAEYITLPEENLHLAPASTRDDVAVFAEPVAAAFRVPEQLPFTGKERVIVLGDGKLGQLVAQVLWLQTKNLVCVGKHAAKLAHLARLGIGTALLDDPLERGADVVVEATGSPRGLERALELVRPEGVVVLKTTSAQATPLDLSVPVVQEVTLLGSRCGPFRPALEALAMGNVDVQPLISGAFELRDAAEALRQAQSPHSLKILLHI